jgi:hypothetical protein
MNPSRVEKWQRWLEPLQNDVTSLQVNREIWNCMAQTIDANPDIPRSVALVFIRSNYVTSQAVAIRRLAEPSSRVVSFAGLLTEIAQCPEDLTAASVLPARSDRERPRWEHEFAAGKSGGHVDPAKVSDHLSTLGATVESIKRYVDNQVAHRDKQPMKDDPTFNHLNAAIDYLATLSQWCEGALLYADRIVMPIGLGDIMAPFRVAWLPPA